MKVPGHMVDKIKIDVAHCMGRIGSRPHRMMIKLESRDSKINLRSYEKNLSHQRITISDLLPKRMQENRSTQLSQSKQEKQQQQP